MYDLNTHRLAQAQTRERLAAAEARDRELSWEREPGLGARLAAAVGRRLIALGRALGPQRRQDERHDAAWERP